MERSERIALLRWLEKKRKSKVIAYMAGDRVGLETKIASDVHPIFYDHLNEIGRQERIDLFLYTAGGLTNSAYALVNMIREYCDHLGVIIPFKSLSGGTLIALGADEIIMTRMGQLSPIDPSITTPFGPQVMVPGKPSPEWIPISVEDVVSYINLARNEFGIKDEEGMTKVFDRLSQTVNPLALGSVNRVREQIEFLGITLLNRHSSDEEKNRRIVDTLIRGRYSHDYIISRREAKDVIGLNVLDVNQDFESKVIELFRHYQAVMDLNVPFHPEHVLNGREEIRAVFNRAIIESTVNTNVFRSERTIKRVYGQQPGMPLPIIDYSQEVHSERWVRDEKI